MKAGLVTFYHIHHYGALLQAAATERAVESLGGACEIIDYYVNQNNDLFRKPTGVGSAAADVHTRCTTRRCGTATSGSSAFPRTISASPATGSRVWRSCAARSYPMT